jgi:hypothetical protein
MRLANLKLRCYRHRDHNHGVKCLFSMDAPVLVRPRWQKNLPGSTVRSSAAFFLARWLDGSTQAQVERHLAEAARQASKRIPREGGGFWLDPDENIQVVINRFLEWLGETSNRRWLSIFDNVDQDYLPRSKKNGQGAFDLERFFPSGDHGSSLIITRVAPAMALSPRSI